MHPTSNTMAGKVLNMNWSHTLVVLPDGWLHITMLPYGPDTATSYTYITATGPYQKSFFR
jgi:hypothetical protein